MAPRWTWSPRYGLERAQTQAWRRAKVLILTTDARLPSVAALSLPSVERKPRAAGSRAGRRVAVPAVGLHGDPAVEVGVAQDLQDAADVQHTLPERDEAAGGVEILDVHVVDALSVGAHELDRIATRGLQMPGVRAEPDRRAVEQPLDLVG